MATPKNRNLYKAGSGLFPPYFAGREYETEVIENTLDAIQGGAGPLGYSPDPILVLVGPRGVGKTVLLERATELAKKRGIYIAELDPNLLAGPEEKIVSQVFKDKALKRAFGKLKSIGLSFMGTGASVGLNEAQKSLRQAMLAFLTKQPVLLYLDEAHHCEPDALNLLLGIVQGCMKSKLPLALILAGTPGLDSHLRRCRATYVERSKRLSINTLSSDEAKVAMEIPAKVNGRPMKPDALKLLLDWSDNYPYFIQLVGTHAWNASKKRAGKEITVADAKIGLALAEKERNEFYRLRRDELKKRHLVDYAAQVVGIIRDGNGDVDEDDVEFRLMEMNNDMDEDRALEVVGELQELGYLWHTGDGLEPGISSMFDYVMRKHERKKRKLIRHSR